MQKKLLPIGTDSFEKLRTMNKYYVDKTLLIKDLLNAGGEVTLFTRPRRFGKTLNMSMLQAFFEIPRADSSGQIVKPEALFEGLAIAREKELCAQHMGKYPVVAVSLKSVNGLTFDVACTMLSRLISREADRFSFLLDSDKLTELNKNNLRKLLVDKPDITVVKDSLFILTELLARHYGRKVILLIDEYDVPLDKAYQNGFYDEMLDVIRDMFSQALKTNNNLSFAVLTGCLRVSKESIFTGLNNLKVYAINDTRFAGSYGFTDQEVRTLLDYYELQEHYDAVKEWYDGYRFGEQEIYCPWDVINYACDLLDNRSLEPQAYWLNTSGNEMVRRLFNMAGTLSEQLAIEELIAGKSLRKTLNLQLTHNEIYSDINNVWSMLFMTGYLTLAGDRTTDNSAAGNIMADNFTADSCTAGDIEADDLTAGNIAADSFTADDFTADNPEADSIWAEEQDEDSFELVIPNKEIRKIYQKQVLAWLKTRTWPAGASLAALHMAFATGDTQSIQELLNAQLLTTISFFDAYESFYHGFLLALLNTRPGWQAVSNRETGRGRSDIVVESTDRQLGLVIEVKYAKKASAEQLQDACTRAIKQITDNDYAALLRTAGFAEIWAYGLAFCGKQCMAAAQKLS